MQCICDIEEPRFLKFCRWLRLPTQLVIQSLPLFFSCFIGLEYQHKNVFNEEISGGLRLKFLRLKIGLSSIGSTRVNDS